MDEIEMKPGDLKRGDKYTIPVKIEELDEIDYNRVLVSTDKGDYFFVLAHALEPVNDKYKQALINLAKAERDYQQAKIYERASARAANGRAMTVALSMGMELLEDVKNV